MLYRLMVCKRDKEFISTAILEGPGFNSMEFLIVTREATRMRERILSPSHHRWLEMEPDGEHWKLITDDNITVTIPCEKVEVTIFDDRSKPNNQCGPDADSPGDRQDAKDAPRDGAEGGAG